MVSKGVAITKHFNSADYSTQAELIAGVTGYSIHVTGLRLSTDTATDIKLMEASTDLLGPMYFGANGGAVLDKLNLILSSGEGLDVKAGDAGNISVDVDYYIAK